MPKSRVISKKHHLLATVLFSAKNAGNINNSLNFDNPCDYFYNDQSSEI